MAIIEKPLDQDEFMRLQQEGAGYEYEHGKLIPLMPVEGRQSSTWGDIYLALGNHVQRQRLGKAWLDLLTYLDPAGDVRYFPDIVYLANDVLDRYDGRKIVGAPTLVVEVTSPDTDEPDEGRKKRQYHAAGVPWYWVASSVENVLREYRHEEARYALVSETPFGVPFRPQLFPGLEIVVSSPDP